MRRGLYPKNHLFGENVNRGADPYPVIKIDNIGRSHSDATIAYGSPYATFLWGSVDVDIPSKAVLVLGLAPSSHSTRVEIGSLALSPGGSISPGNPLDFSTPLRLRESPFPILTATWCLSNGVSQFSSLPLNQTWKSRWSRTRRESLGLLPPSPDQLY